MSDSLSKQEGGAHYRKYVIQPVEYSIANNLSFCAGNVVKYVTRYKDKNGPEDIRKAIHYLEMILEFEYPSPEAEKSVSETEESAAGPKLILKLESDDMTPGAYQSD